ncbi:MAG: ATP synthase F1 subunit delta, partial [Fusobacterium periodonticum]|nr:ATP synthase F1 subunit delta [Fusobacterium periodonticum]
ELSEEQRTKLINKLSQKTGKEINLEVKVDKSILGGGIIKIGDKIIDGSIRRELDNWKKS